MPFAKGLCFLILCCSSTRALATRSITYETHDADVANDLPCYRLTLGALLDGDDGIEIDGVYRGSPFILRATAPDDCTHFVGEAAYDEHHSFFIDLQMDERCRIPVRFVAELKARHDKDGIGYGVALCKKLRRSRRR